MEKFLQFIFILMLVIGAGNMASAEDTPLTIHLTLRAGEVFFSEDVPLYPDSTVLSILKEADTASDIFTVSNIQEFSFGSYLKCINIKDIGNKCDDWQYTVNGSYPSTSIDQTTLSGSGSVYFYFSAKNRISLSSDVIQTSDTVVVTVEKYDYEDGLWSAEDTATIGVTQPDPLGSFNPPTEIMTGTVDGSGQVSFSSIPVGIYDVGIRDEYGYYFPTKPLTVNPVVQHTGGSSSSLSIPLQQPAGKVLGAETKIGFDMTKAVEFLISQQTENGAFGEDMYTDWTTVALASTEVQIQKIQPILKLVKYLSLNKPAGAMLTDYERHAMAIMSLGLNPHNANGENYVEKIVSSFDGKQFGDINEDNDDIFALVVLNNAGYGEKEKIIEESLKFVLERQKENGSWDESIDMTGAGIQALSNFKENEKVKSVLIKAKTFLEKTQGENGSWNDDASSTAWAIGGITALGEKIEDWKKKDRSPLDYLATIQDADGGVKDENIKNKIWKTAYVVSALSGKTWNQAMEKFEKIETQKNIEKPKKILKQKVAETAPATPATLTPPLPSESPIENSEEGWFGKFFQYIFNF
ncbi:MAG: prenyltransferase/squalene oxidase repeat-containing protein [Candidatus Paceibacterota bacterium]